MNKNIWIAFVLFFQATVSFAGADFQQISKRDATVLGYSNKQIESLQASYLEQQALSDAEGKETYIVALSCLGVSAGVVINGGLNGCLGFGKKGLYLVGILFGSLADVVLVAEADVNIGFIEYDRDAHITGTYGTLKVSAAYYIGGSLLSFEKPDGTAVLRLFGAAFGFGLGAHDHEGTAKIGAI